MNANSYLYDHEIESDIMQTVSTPHDEDEMHDFDLGDTPFHDFAQSTHDYRRAGCSRVQESSPEMTSQTTVPGMFSQTEISTRQHQQNLPPMQHSWRDLQKTKGLPRQRSRYAKTRGQQSSNPISITRPNLTLHNHCDTESTSVESDSIERWRNSPPEFEPASLIAINQALVDCSIQSHSHPNSWAPASQVQKMPSATDSPSSRLHHPRSSVASSESDVSDSSRTSTVSNTSRNRARLQARRTKKAKDKEDGEWRRFKCTFCCDDFQTKYDWARHEKSLHLDVEEWHCVPYGSIVFSQTTGSFHCAFCNALEPSDEHLEDHGHESCNDQTRPTTFHRKDHLVQHLRLAHRLSSMPLIEDWKIKSGVLTARCGFCDLMMSSWNERTAHLSDHFRQGLDMTHWKGDHGFDKMTAAQVRNAIPPYCIANEAYALVPFKPAYSETQDQFNQISYSINNINLGQLHTQAAGSDSNPGLSVVDTRENTTQGQLIESKSGAYIDMLASHLGRFAREQTMLGNALTDEMFRVEARRAIYDSESDGWDTTVADNEQWLKSFKEQLEPFS